MKKPNDVPLIPQVLAHYERVGPLVEAALAKTPIVFANFPAGLTEPARYHVTTVPLSTEKLLWLVHREYAIEFFTWAPALLGISSLRFGRILLLPAPGVGFDKVKLAALAMRATLFDLNQLEAIPLLDGGTGLALWIPLADHPQADALRPKLRETCLCAVQRHPELLSMGTNANHDGRVHLHVRSNASGHYSSIPYGLRVPALTVCTPIRWAELADFSSAAAFDVGTIGARLQSAGDVFESELKPIAHQRFAAAPA